jgi:hypothetical protein
MSWRLLSARIADAVVLVESRQPAGAGGSQIPPPHVLRDP